MSRKPRKRRNPSSRQPHQRRDRGVSPPRLLHPRNIFLALICLGITLPVGAWLVTRSDLFATPERSTSSRQGDGDVTTDPRSKSTSSIQSPPASKPALEILAPLEGAVFPRDIAPTRFFWEDTVQGVDRWRIRFEFSSDEAPLEFTSDAPGWTPPVPVWEEIKQNSLESDAVLSVCGIHHQRPDDVLSCDQVTIRTSRDEVGAPIFYREVNLPFVEAVQDPAAHIRWRFGPVSSPRQPRVVLDRLPLCGNCHSFSRDGRILGMDVDYGSDKGSYVIAPVSHEMTFDDPKIITWSDFRPDDNRGTFGLLSRVSPDGRYVISTVKDRSVFTATEDFEFSQLFFPIQGILAYYDRETESFHALPGADDERYVQTNAVWSPDGEYIVFARSKAYHSEAFEEKERGLTKAEDVQEFLSGALTFKFDLYRVAFNKGRGGEPEPLEGASHNGMSNYFPKYSPDGRWIVFCRARSFMLLQPDSELYIIPAEGGEARRLECNTDRMNSWHSWSPNGRWLVFSSKAYSPYTELFLTHVDDQGRTTPPVALSHFTSENMAANIPEFVNADPDAIRLIRTEFIDDVSYLHAGQWNVRDGEYELAIDAFRKALELNPENTEARVALAGALLALQRLEEAREEIDEALAQDPANTKGHWIAGALCEEQGRFQEAVRCYQRALEGDPNYAPAHQSLGRLLLAAGEVDRGRRHLLEAAEAEPEGASVYVELAGSYLREGNSEEAVAMYRRAVERDPRSQAALIGLAMALLQRRQRGREEVAEALAAARKACELTDYQHSPALIVLADACSAAGRFSEGVAVARRALNIAQQTGDPSLISTARSLLRHCESQMPRQ